MAVRAPWDSGYDPNTGWPPDDSTGIPWGDDTALPGSFQGGGAGFGPGGFQGSPRLTAPASGPPPGMSLSANPGGGAAAVPGDVFPARQLHHPAAQVGRSVHRRHLDRERLERVPRPPLGRRSSARLQLGRRGRKCRRRASARRGQGRQGHQPAAPNSACGHSDAHRRACAARRRRVQSQCSTRPKGREARRLPRPDAEVPAAHRLSSSWHGAQFCAARSQRAAHLPIVADAPGARAFHRRSSQRAEQLSEQPERDWGACPDAHRLAGPSDSSSARRAARSWASCGSATTESRHLWRSVHDD